MTYKCARCSAPSTNGMHCDKHAATAVRETVRKRKDHHSLYSSKRWKSIRELVLCERPLCESCAFHGITTPGMEVDHIWPVSLCPDLSHTISNMQSLCKSCHSSKTASEKKGIIYNYRVGTITNSETGSVIPMDCCLPKE